MNSTEEHIEVTPQDRHIAKAIMRSVDGHAPRSVAQILAVYRQGFERERDKLLNVVRQRASQDEGGSERVVLRELGYEVKP